MAKMPPNPYDVGPPDPEVIPCPLCFGDVDDPGEWFGCTCPECPVCGCIGNPDCFSIHMPPKDRPQPYGKIFYDAMVAEVNAEHPRPDGHPIQLTPWDKLNEWERHAIHRSVLTAIRKFRDKEVFHNEQQ